MRVIPLLKRRKFDKSRAAKTLSKKSDTELLTALHCPDHSEEAKEFLKELLLKRGITKKQIENGGLPPEELSIPIFWKPASLEDVLKAWRRKRKTHHIIKLIWITVIAYGLILAIGEDLQKAEEGIETLKAAPSQIVVQELLDRGLTQEDIYEIVDPLKQMDFSQQQIDKCLRKLILLSEQGLSEEEISQHYSDTLLSIIAKNESSEPDKHFTLYENILFGLFWAMILSSVFFENILWKPNRILLLRGFGNRRISLRIRRFLGKNLKLYGHVFTLSDKYWKDSLVYRLMEWAPTTLGGVIALIFYPVFKRYKKPMYIRKVRDFNLLKGRLQNRLLLNQFWLLSFIDKTNKIKSTDTWWRLCVDLLMAACQVILIDLSLVKEGTKWELGRIHGTRLEEKCIMMVNDAKYDQAIKVLSEFWQKDRRPKVYCYNDRGLIDDPDSFNSCLGRIISSG